MKTKFISILALGAVLVAYAAAPLTVGQVIKEPKKYDGKDVVVKGTVSEFKAKTSKAGNKYTVFKLKGENKELSVYMRDHMAKPVKNDDLVVVTGQFAAEKKVGTQTFKNEIDISKKEGKKYGVKLLPKPKA